MLGPDGKPLEVRFVPRTPAWAAMQQHAACGMPAPVALYQQVVQVEKVTEEAWAGVAMVDRGQNDEPTNWGCVHGLACGEHAQVLALATTPPAAHRLTPDPTPPASAGAWPRWRAATWQP